MIRVMTDIMSREKRSSLMRRVRQRGTALEQSLRSALRKHSVRFRTNVDSLPGRPDIVPTRSRVAVFVDGDFWHGWRFPVWRNKLTPFWQVKIEANRARDRRNFGRLRRLGWTVVRIWEHELRRSKEEAVSRILRALGGPGGRRTCVGSSAPTKPLTRRRRVPSAR